MPTKSTQKKIKNKNTSVDGAATFEDGLAKLEGIVEDIQSGALGLNESIGKLSAAKDLIKSLEGVLDGADRLVKGELDKVNKDDLGASR